MFLHAAWLYLRSAPTKEFVVTREIPYGVLIEGGETGLNFLQRKVPLLCRQARLLSLANRLSKNNNQGGGLDFPALAFAPLMLGSGPDRAFVHELGSFGEVFGRTDDFLF